VPSQLVSRYARYEFTSRAVGATNLNVLPVPSRCAGHLSRRYCYRPYSPTLGHTGSDLGALGCDQDYSGLIAKVTFWLSIILRQILSDENLEAVAWRVLPTK